MVRPDPTNDYMVRDLSVLLACVLRMGVKVRAKSERESKHLPERHLILDWHSVAVCIPHLYG